MPLVTLTEYTDPYCTWCWGSEPILRHVNEAFTDQVELRFVMGGLVEDVDTFYDSKNRIGGENMFEQVAEHWEEASTKHGMPVDGSVWLDMEGDFTSTWPACKAVNAALLQDEEKGKRFLRRMREAAAAEHRMIHRVPVQNTLAENVGLDPGKLGEALGNGSAAEAFQEDRAECEQYNVTGFPTFRAYNNETGEETVFHGYTAYDDMVNTLMEVTGDRLEQTEPDSGRENVKQFVEKYRRVAVQEVAEVFHIPRRTAETLLEEVYEANHVDKQDAGNGVFYVAADTRNGDSHG